MNIFSTLVTWTLSYKIIDTVRSLYYYIRDYMRISKILYSEDFKTILKKYLNLDVEVDWIGRLYGIINPLIDIDGKFNVNNAVIEIDGDNTNNNDQVRYWAYKQLRLIGEIFRLKNIYDYISMDLEKVGPTFADNYLIVFDITSRKKFARSFRNMLIQLSIYILIAILIYFII